MEVIEERTGGEKRRGENGKEWGDTERGEEKNGEYRAVIKEKERKERKGK